MEAVDDSAGHCGQRHFHLVVLPGADIREKQPEILHCHAVRWAEYAQGAVGAIEPSDCPI